MVTEGSNVEFLKRRAQALDPNRKHDSNVVMRLETKAQVRVAFIEGGDALDAFVASFGISREELSPEDKARLREKALSAGDALAGGYVVSGDLLAELLRAESQVSAMRRISRQLPPMKGQGLRVSSQESLFTNAEWTTEIDTGDEDLTAPFGARDFLARPITKRIRTSQAFLRAESGMAEQWLVESLAEVVAVPQEAAFITGPGVGTPRGVLNTPGLPVYTTAVARTLSIADVKKWRYSLPARFQKNARILCHVDFLNVLAEIDTNGVLGLDRGTILNVPYELSDQYPSAGTTNGGLTGDTLTAVIGDFAFFWIVDREPYILKLSELYAEYNQVGFQYWRETDGQAMLPQAFYALKIKA